MKAKYFCFFACALGFIGICVAIANVRDATYIGKCRFMGGVVIFIATMALLLIVYGKRKREIIRVDESVEEMPLASFVMDSEAGLFRVKCLHDARFITKDLPQNTTRIFVNEEKAKGEIAVLEVSTHTEHYRYKFLFIYWPEKTSVVENYRLLVSKPIDIILDFYAGR